MGPSLSSWGSWEKPRHDDTRRSHVLGQFPQGRPTPNLYQTTTPSTSHPNSSSALRVTRPADGRLAVAQRPRHCDRGPGLGTSSADFRRRPARRNAGRSAMIHGLDTGFLVAAEVREHAEHAGARVTLAQVLSAGDVVAIAPQVWIIGPSLHCMYFWRSRPRSGPREFPTVGRRCGSAASSWVDHPTVGEARSQDYNACPFLRSGS
jgi:hypothetical protein